MNNKKMKNLIPILSLTALLTIASATNIASKNEQTSVSNSTKLLVQKIGTENCEDCKEFGIVKIPCPKHNGDIGIFDSDYILTLEQLDSG